MYIEKNDSLYTYKSNGNHSSVIQLTDKDRPIPKNSITEEMLQNTGFRFKGKEKVGNVLCSLYVSDDTKLWLWNHIIIKAEINVMNINIQKKAIHIETGIDISPKQFTFSKNNTFQFDKTRNYN